jgi:hypothetical protein
MDNTSLSRQEENLRAIELSLEQKRKFYNIELRKFALEFCKNTGLPIKIEDCLIGAEKIYEWLKK